MLCELHKSWIGTEARESGVYFHKSHRSRTVFKSFLQEGKSVVFFPESFVDQSDGVGRHMFAKGALLEKIKDFARSSNVARNRVRVSQ